MKREPRGFQFTLEPMRSKCDWDLQRLNMELAHLHQRIDEQSKTVRGLEADLAAALSEFSGENNKMQVIYADRQCIAHAYLAHLGQQLRAGEKLLMDLETEREVAIEKQHRLKKLGDELDENRSEEIKEYTKTKAQTENAEADDAWLRAMKWRAMQ